MAPQSPSKTFANNLADDASSNDSSLERVAREVVNHEPASTARKGFSDLGNDATFKVDAKIMQQLDEFASTQRSTLNLESNVQFAANERELRQSGVVRARRTSTPSPEKFVDLVVPNLRDLAVSSCMENLKMNKIFRSARPFSRSLNELYSVFVTILGVKYIIDLRDDDLNSIQVEQESRVFVSKFYRPVRVPTCKPHSNHLRKPSGGTPHPGLTTDSALAERPARSSCPPPAEIGNKNPTNVNNNQPAVPHPAPQFPEPAPRSVVPAEVLEIANQAQSSPGTPMEVQSKPKRQRNSPKLRSDSGSRSGTLSVVPSAPSLQNPSVGGAVTEMQRLVDGLTTRGWWRNIPAIVRTSLVACEKHNSLMRMLFNLNREDRTLFVVNILDSELVKRRIMQEVTSSPLLPMMLFYKVADKLTGTALAPYYFCKYFLSMHDIFESYIEMLANCGFNFATALKLIALMDGPILFHCSLGKDRTGILAMLLLSILGATESMILFDYSLTEMAGVHYQTYSRRFIVEYSGLSEGFCSSSVETARSTLEFIKTTWGGMFNYLDAIGVTREWRDFIRSKYLIDPSLAAEPTS